MHVPASLQQAHGAGEAADARANHDHQRAHRAGPAADPPQDMLPSCAQSAGDDSGGSGTLKWLCCHRGHVIA